MTLKREAWISLLPRDPRETLLACDEPYARFATVTAVLGVPELDAEVQRIRNSVVRDTGVRALVAGLQPWNPSLRFGGHNSPAFSPNTLRLLHTMGVRSGDFAAIDRMLDAMLRHQSEDGRFLSPFGASSPSDHKAVWAALPCDHFAILEVLLLYGRQDVAQVGPALARVRSTFEETSQGPGWRCIPDPVTKWRGPGRKNDVCLGVTVEALRLLALVASSKRPKAIVHAARTLLGAWRGRSKEKPYMFGHGQRFVNGKWPPTWYDASAFLAALAPYPSVWKSRQAVAEDRKSTLEIVKAFASTFGPDGQITPRSCYKGFEGFSFGQKKRPSPFATARGCALLRRFSAIMT